MAHEFVIVPTAGTFAEPELAAMNDWWSRAEGVTPHHTGSGFWLVFCDDAERDRRMEQYARKAAAIHETTATVWVRPAEVSLTAVGVDASDQAVRAFVGWVLARFPSRFEGVGEGPLDPDVLLSLD